MSHTDHQGDRGEKEPSSTIGTYFFRSLAYALLGHMDKNLGGEIRDDLLAKSVNDYKFFLKTTKNAS